MRIKYPDNKLPPSTSKQLMQAATRLKGKAVVVEGGSGGGAAAAGGGLSIVMILNPLTRSTQRISQVIG